MTRYLTVFSFYLFVLILFSGQTVLKSQENSEKQMGRSKTIQERRDGPLPMGDYSQLEYTIIANKDKFAQGEPIFIRTQVKNNSTDYVTINISCPISLFATDDIKVLNQSDKEVSLTSYGSHMQEELRKNMLRSSFTTASCFAFGHGNEFVLAPNNINDVPSVLLNLYFDLSLPGKYEITFFRTTFMRGQEYKQPLPSNTITIEVSKNPLTP